MSFSPPNASRWHTAALGGSADTSPMELQGLQQHLGTCQALRGRWFDLRCGTVALRGYAAARLVTTVAVLALLVGLGFAWL